MSLFKMTFLFQTLCLVAVFCMMTEANHHMHKNQHRPQKVERNHRNVGPPQKQTMFYVPVEQGTSTRQSFGGPSIGGPSTGFVSNGDFDSSSSSEVSDFDMDVDADTNDVENVGSFVIRRNGNQISGNRRPMSGGNGRQQFMSGMEGGDYDQLKARTTGSSGRGVGIAFGVLGLLALVVAAAFFTIRRYRHNIPVVVRT